MKFTTFHDFIPSFIFSNGHRSEMGILKNLTIPVLITQTIPVP